LQLQKREIQKAHQEVQSEIENRKRAGIDKNKPIIKLQDALHKV
jgi:hypothetical protein